MQLIFISGGPGGSSAAKINGHHGHDDTEKILDAEDFDIACFDLLG
jgi:hypothetical protein